MTGQGGAARVPQCNGVAGNPWCMMLAVVHVPLAGPPSAMAAARPPRPDHQAAVMGPTDRAPQPSGNLPQRPRWNDALRALREARGVTQDGWAAYLSVGRRTVQHWEAGERTPDPGAEAAILAYCRERNLFRPFARGPLAGLDLTPDLLHDLLAEARLDGNQQSSTGNRVEAGARSGLSTAPTVLAEPRARLSNLPASLTSFVGREQELTALRRALGGTRLLTLTGAGGCGKTRLALELAGELLWAYPHGIGFVELASLADPALVPATVAAALGLWTTGERPVTELLVEHLASRHLLLVLDNCEHLLGACAELVETLLRACPHLEVVITSREPLGMGGETIWRVPPLSLPSTTAGALEADAVRLFVERAQQFRPDFALTAANEAAVVQICERLDGIPLALELAAACIKVLSVEQIAERLTDRFRLLTGGSRTALPRQQTLRATLDWSYELLTEPERALLRRLAVFAGGWSLEAAEAVCGALGSGQWAGGEDDLQDSIADCPSPTALEHDVLDILRALVDKSLVVVEQHGGVMRFRLLETVRQYAAEQLTAAGDARATQARHAGWCLALAEAAWPYRNAPERGAWLERLTVEHDNLRTALDWCLAGEHGTITGLRLGSLLCWFWEVRGHLSEGRRWLAMLLERGGDAPPAVRARALNGAGVLAQAHGDYDAAAQLHEQSLALRRELGDEAAIADVLSSLGNVANYRNDPAGAQALFEESLSVGRRLADPRRIALALNNLGITARQRGEPARAVALYEESLALARELGNTTDVARTSLNLGNALRDQGALDGAVTRYRESLSLYWEMQNSQRSASCLQGMAGVAVARGDAGRAARLCGSADALRAVLGVQLPAASRARFDQIVATAQATLGDAEFAAAWAAGQVLSLDQAVAAGLSD